MSVAKRDFFNLLKVSIESINPSQLIRNSVHRQNSNLIIDKNFIFKNQNLINNLCLKNNVYIAAFGKAAYDMALEMEKTIGEHLCRAIAVLPFNLPVKTVQSKIEFYSGGKFNLPDQDSVMATKKISQMVSHLGQNDVFIALVSGGGSALLALPENFTPHEDYNLELKLKTIKILVKSGADINDLNTVRSCLSQVKNGKLCYLAHPATTIALIISDVIGDPLEIISSGPCCAYSLYHPNSQAQKAINVLKKLNILDKVPKEIVYFLAQKTSDKIDSEIKFFFENQRVCNFLIGNNKLATLAIMEELRKEAYENDYRVMLTNSLSGEAQSIGFIFGVFSFLLLQMKDKKIDWVKNELDLTELIKSRVENFQPDNHSLVKILYSKIFLDSNLKEKILGGKKVKFCVISGGETTVNMANCKDIGKGGRNQEMTLAFEYSFTRLMQNNQLIGLDLLFSSFGSDGIDGPTDAAGAYYLFEKNKIFNQKELIDYLDAHDSYNYFAKYDRLITIGPTGTNVSDLQILLINF